MSSRCRLSLHTVFLARENMAYLKEWIVYHALLGVEHVYLYDNSGSIGRDGSDPTTNKSGINFFEPTKHLTDADIAEILKTIISEVSVDVTLIPWQPRDSNGQIVYGYNQSIRHCIELYGSQIEWMAFIDVDEFLFSPTNIDLKQELDERGREGSNGLIIRQKKFLDRFLSPSPFVTGIYECIEGIDTSSWAPKNIVRVADLALDNLVDMHTMPVRGGNVTLETEVLRFNHYNVNPKQLEWMKWFYSSNEDFQLNAIDDGMKRYRQQIADGCQQCLRSSIPATKFNV